MIVNILHHDNCFDGASSAAVFKRFYLDKINPHADFSLQGMTHETRQEFPESLFSGDENTIVDFKYASSNRLTWWFDHHHSAFLTAQDEQHFREDRSGKKFYDTSFKSCTKFIATIGARQFGFECPMLADLVYWADIIDGAQYPDARTAVEVAEPAQKLAAVIEANRETNFLHQIINQLAEQPLQQVATQKSVMDRYAPLAHRHLESIKIIQKNSAFNRDVIFFDLSNDELEGYNKFIPYELYPEANYSVSLLRTPKRMKISVGWNPWSRKVRTHNLAKICERYGGGGHPVVAAISLNPDAIERARSIAREIVEELKDQHQP
jgi:hypothetical protein